MHDDGSALQPCGLPLSDRQRLRPLYPLFGVGALAAGAFSLFCACDSGTNNLLITVSNLPQRAVTVSVVATLNGAKADNSMDFTGPLDRLGVALPSSTSGRLTLDLTALDSDRCTQGSATVTTDLPSQHVSSPLAAAITTKSPRQCGALPGCAANTVCPQTTPAQKNPIVSLWAISPSDIWGAGWNGTLIHFDGATWSPVPSGVSTDLNALWASSTSDVWAVGASGKTLHYNGTSWTPVPIGAVYPLNAVWGVSPKDIWAVGSNAGVAGGPGEFWHFDGTAWAKVVTGINGALYGVWASAPNDIFACGAGGVIMHFDTAWKSKMSGTTNSLYGIWGSAPNQVFAVGLLGTVVRYDGTAWKTLSAGGTTQDLNGLFGDSKTVYIVGTTGTLLRSSPTLDSFVAAPTTISTDLYTIQLGANGINWLGGSSGTSGVLAYFDTRP